MLCWKKGLNKFKKEGDGTTPIGTFGLGNIYYRSDRVSKPVTNFNCIKIKKIWVGVTIQVVNFIIN